jgi:hypothetical protein
MGFEQTKIFYTLVAAFVKRGEELRHTINKEQVAKEFAERWVKIHGAPNIKKVCAKANQKLKIKLFTI